MEKHKLLITRLEKFKEIIESPDNFNENQAEVFLHELKIILMKNEYLSQDARQINFAERMMFREILELAIILCVRTIQCSKENEKRKQIQNYFKQLSFYYFENNDLPQSQRMFTMINVNLLMDLAFNDNDIYMVNLAQVQSAFPKINFNIQFVLDVERCLQDNSISKLFELQENSPSILYDVFLQKILGRIRETLAKDVMKKSERLTIDHLAKLLQFKDESEIIEFTQSQKWRISTSGEIIQTFQKTTETKSDSAQIKLNNILSYASRFNSLM